MAENNDRAEPTPESLTKSSPRRWRRWGLDLVLVLAVVFAVQWWQSRPLVSGPAPPLAGYELSGHPLDLAALAGRPVLVHFWASWCPVCRVMDGSVARIAEDHSVISVAMNSGEPSEVLAAQNDSGHRFPTIADPDGRLAARWGVRGVPASFIVDAQGRIRFATAGMSSGPGLRLRLWLANVLGYRE